jgi:hypothetical protein
MAAARKRRFLKKGKASKSTKGKSSRSMSTRKQQQTEASKWKRQQEGK